MGHEQLNVRLPADLFARFHDETRRREAMKAEVVAGLIELWLSDPRIPDRASQMTGGSGSEAGA